MDQANSEIISIIDVRRSITLKEYQTLNGVSIPQVGDEVEDVNYDVYEVIRRKTSFEGNAQYIKIYVKKIGQ